MKTTVHFALRTDRPSSDGSVAIYIRITFNRAKILSLSTGKSIPIRKEYDHLSQEDIKQYPADQRHSLYYWDKRKERATRGFGSMETINMFLDDEKKRANDIIYDLSRDKKLCPDRFKKAFVRSTEDCRSFLTYCLNEINQVRSEQYASETKRTYKSVLTKVDDYKPGIALKDVTYKFLVDYENFMLKPIDEGGKGNNGRTVENNMKIIRTMIGLAIKNGDLSKNDYPFEEYKIKESPKYFSTRDFLEPDEIIQLERMIERYEEPKKPLEAFSNEDWGEREKKGIITPGEYRTLRAFLIGVYTGLRFRDVLFLDRKQHIYSRYITHPKTGEKTMRYYIEMDLHKTGVNVVIPLIDQALKLINVNETGKVCQEISNTKCNKHLKRIQRKAKLDKTLTFHVSRHSFATIAFEYDIPEKVVQSILGHRNKRYTEIYTHISNKKLFFEMEKMNKGYNDTALLIQEVDNGQKEASKLLAKLQKLDEKKLSKLMEFLDLLDY